MVPIRCGELRSGMGSVLSGRMVFMKMVPANLPTPDAASALVAAGARKFKASLAVPDETAALQRERGGIEIEQDSRKSAVAKAVRGAFPLRDVVGDHAGGFHRGLAELGIAGDFALHALAFGMQQVAQAFEFGNQVLDFRERGAGDALDQRVDVVDGGFVVGLERRRRSCSARPAPDGADRRRRCGRNRGCRPRPPRPRRGCCPLQLIQLFQNDVTFIGCSPVSR